MLPHMASRRTSKKRRSAKSGSGRKRPWTDEERRFVRQNLGKLTHAEIGEKIGRSKAAVQNESSRLNRERREKERAAEAPTPTSPEELRERIKALSKRIKALRGGELKRRIVKLEKRVAKRR
ncbi:MAG: hypothetical protein CMN29_12815 [Sandaracinus sp.]|nr:hypothetical protein [Sandaracinus sp.]